MTKKKLCRSTYGGDTIYMMYPVKTHSEYRGMPLFHRLNKRFGIYWKKGEPFHSSRGNFYLVAKENY